MFSRRLWFATISATLLYSPALADVRVLPSGERPHDIRLQPLKDLDGYFPFTPPTSREAWTERSERVRKQITVALGLWPEPSRTPLNAVIHGRIERDDYTVEKVYFEAMPGFFVTGSLYRPKESSGRNPGILCPHGHWPDGRFMEASDSEVQKGLTSGAEKFENAARSPLQARCVQLARMGCVVFHYDMLGYADSLQIPMEVAHKFATQRPDMTNQNSWGLFSPQAETYAQSIMGLQTWNSVRALDFLQTLPDVDPDRLAVTGASGGGTQTMLLAALDNRVKAAFPAVMVSTAMQGGCTCENASLLRVGTGNIEFAALFAPKPMAMTAANDWTKEMEMKGFPELKRLWSLLGAPENVALTPLIQFPHNYNAASRAAMYAWFNKHLGLNVPSDRLAERDFQRLSRNELSVWDDKHPAPAGGPEFEQKLLQWWHKDVDSQLQQESPKAFRAAVETVIGRRVEDIDNVTFDVHTKEAAGNHVISVGMLRNKSFGEELPALFVSAKESKGTTVLWLDDHGKSGLFTADRQFRPEVQSLLDSGINVMGVDLLYQGEFLTGDQPFTKTRRVKNPREAAAYTFGYNHSLFAQRTHDVLTALRYLKSEGTGAGRIAIAAFGSTAPIAAAARAVAPDAVGAAAIAVGDFQFLKVNDLQHPSFQPAAARFGDVPGLLSVGAPGALLVLGKRTDLSSVSETYRRAGSSGALATSGDADPRIAAEWLKEQFKRAVTP
ncbi:alpha/beta hydrolase family protein [Verrucomicrobiota bacterium sgz303538]